MILQPFKDLMTKFTVKLKLFDSREAINATYIGTEGVPDQIKTKQKTKGPIF